MAVIGKLAAILSLKSAQFESGMKRSAAATTKLQTTAAVATGAIAKLGRTMATAFAGAAIARGVQSALTALDDLAKTSRKLGVGTDELVGLRLAAELTGVEAAVLDKSLERLVVRISEATQGTGEAADALEALGLDANRINLMAPGEQMRVIADAMGGIENQADRARIAYDLFGRSGVGLINTLALGSEGLAEVQQKAVALGLTFESLKLGGIESAVDELTISNKALAASWQEIVIHATPAITAVAKFGKLAVVAGRGIFAAWQSAWFTILGGAAKVGEEVSGALGMRRGTSVVGDFWGELSDELMGRAGDAWKKAKDLGPSIEKAFTDVVEAQPTITIPEKAKQPVPEIGDLATAAAENVVVAPKMGDLATAAAENVVVAPKMAPAQPTMAPVIEPTPTSTFQQGSYAYTGFGGTGVEPRTHIVADPAEIHLLQQIRDGLAKVQPIGNF